jgi:hypothetical protein
VSSSDGYESVCSEDRGCFSVFSMITLSHNIFIEIAYCYIKLRLRSNFNWINFTNYPICRTSTDPGNRTCNQQNSFVAI